MSDNPGFVRIPIERLKEADEKENEVLDIFFDKPGPALWLSWARLEYIWRLVETGGMVIDLGGGGGVFLPTLSQGFNRVLCIDLHVKAAQNIVKMFNLSNVEVIKEDILKMSFPEGSVDAVIAAEVLEHFRDIEEPMRIVHRILKPGSCFYVSAPTENWIYRLGRKLVGYTKPKDHYHTADDIEEAMRKYFSVEKRISLPCGVQWPVVKPFSIYMIYKARKKTVCPSQSIR